MLLTLKMFTSPLADLRKLSLWVREEKLYLNDTEYVIGSFHEARLIDPIPLDRANIGALYVIYNRKTLNSYFGSTDNIRRRLLAHLNELRRGGHGNSRFQRVFDSCVITDFHVRYFRIEDREQSYRLEQNMLDLHRDNDMVLNASRDARKPTLGARFSDEARYRMSEAKKGKAPTYLSNPEQRNLQCKRVSERLREKWKTPEYRAMFLGASNPSARPVRIGNCVYPTSVEAASAIGITYDAFRKRLRSSNFPDYNYADDDIKR